MNAAIDAILSALLIIVVTVTSVIGWIDAALSDDMARIGFGAGPQVAIWLAATIVLMVLAVRLLGGVVGWLLLILLLLVAIHHMLPAAAWVAPQGWLRPS